MSFKRTMGLNPKSEARNPKEFRNPKSEKLAGPGLKLPPMGVTCVRFRPSEFGLLSDFGFRVSDFLHTLPPRQCSLRRRGSQNELPARGIRTTACRLRSI